MKFFNIISIFFVAFVNTTLATLKTSEIEVALVSVFNESSVEASKMFGNYFMKGIQLSIDENKATLEKARIKIKLNKMNYKDSAQDVIRVSNELIKSSSVAAIGFTYSSHALIGGQILNNNVPFITPYATANRISEIGNYINQSCINNLEIANLLIKLLKKQKKKKVHIVFVSDCSYCVDFKNNIISFLKKFGINYTTSDFLSRDLTEDKLKKVAKTILAQKIDSIIVPNHEVDSGKIIGAFIKNSIKADFYGGDSWSDLGGRTLQLLLKKHSGRSYFVTHWHPDVSNIQSNRFVKIFKKRHAEEPPISSAVLAYNAMNLLIKSLTNCKIYSRASIAKCIRDNKYYYSALGKVRFESGRTLGAGVILEYSKKDSKFNLFKESLP